MRLFGYEIRRVRKAANTCLHPDIKALCEFAFEIDGVEYHQFKNLGDMPPLRYKKHEDFLREAEWRITGTELLACLKETEELIEKSKATDAIIELRAMQYQVSQFIQTDTFYRLFSCLFFTLDENIEVYDYDYNEEKIETFKREPIDTFFFLPPLKEWLPQVDISKKDLEVFSKNTKTSVEHLAEVRSENIKKL